MCSINITVLNINNSTEIQIRYFLLSVYKKQKGKLTCLCTAKTVLLVCIIGGLYTGVMSI